VLRGLRLRRDTADFGPEGRTEDAGRKVSSRPRGPVRDRPRPVFPSGTTMARRAVPVGTANKSGRRVTLTERSEVDGESRRQPAVTVRADSRGVKRNPALRGRR
jgi:hypothetical protein